MNEHYYNMGIYALHPGNPQVARDSFKKITSSHTKFEYLKMNLALGHWCTNRHIDKNIAGLLFFHHSHLKI